MLFCYYMMLWDSQCSLPSYIEYSDCTGVYQLCGLHLVDLLVLYLMYIDRVSLCNLPVFPIPRESEGEERLLRNSRLLQIQDKKQLRKTRKLGFNSLNYYLHSHFLQLDILWKIHFLKVRLNSLSQPLEFLPHKIIFKSSATVVKGRFYFMFSGWFNSKFQRMEQESKFKEKRQGQVRLFLVVLHPHFIIAH